MALDRSHWDMVRFKDKSDSDYIIVLNVIKKIRNDLERPYYRSKRREQSPMSVRPPLDRFIPHISLSNADTEFQIDVHEFHSRKRNPARQDSPEDLMLLSARPRISTFMREGPTFCIKEEGDPYRNLVSEADSQPLKESFRLWWVHVPANNTAWVHVSD